MERVFKTSQAIQFDLVGVASKAHYKWKGEQHDIAKDVVFQNIDMSVVVVFVVVAR